MQYTVGYPSDSLASCYPRDLRISAVFAVSRHSSICPSRYGRLLCRNSFTTW